MLYPQRPRGSKNSIKAASWDDGINFQIKSQSSHLDKAAPTVLAAPESPKISMLERLGLLTFERPFIVQSKLTSKVGNPLLPRISVAET